jgi:RsmE family RNA methyltransferase
LDHLGKPLPHTLSAQERLVLIGPEGGWDETERALFASSALPCYRLAPTILRAETVPAVALTLLHHVQGQ